MLDERLNDLIGTRSYGELKELLEKETPQDLALLMGELDEKQIAVVFRILPKELAAETFVEMDSDVQELLLRSFSDVQLKEIFDEMFLDDTVDIIEEMPANVVRRILRNSDLETRRMINELLHYPDDSAGSIMTVEYVSLRPDMTVEEAFKRIRRVGVDKETIYTCYVTDANTILLGVTTVQTLLTSPDEALVGDIMDTHIIYADTNEDKEEVAREMRKYDFLAMPVVDREKRLVGIVTFDDAQDVMEDETTEDIEKMAAIRPTDKPYLKTGVLETWRKRIPWLLLLMVSATFTGKIISSFETALEKAVILTAFIPMLMDTGGNAGGQASVTIIRGLSLGEVQLRDVLRILWKELRVSILCGVSLAAVAFVKLLLLDGTTVPVALVVSLTLIFTVTLAKLVGCTLPLLAKKVGFDPALMASPFITTIVDALSLMIYFTVATAVLGI